MNYLSAVKSNLPLEALPLGPIQPSPSSTEPPLPAVREEKFDLKRIKTVLDVHQDDIHAIVKLSDQTFITGSKDGSLKKWGLDGKLIKTVFDSGGIDYKKWVTSIASLNDQSWISGSRDRSVMLWNNKGDSVKKLYIKHAPFPKVLPKCKDRNIHRVNCLSSFEKQSGEKLFFAGWATQFTLHDHTSKRLKYAHTSDNDWVYVIQPLSESSLLVVTGCRLDLWKFVPESENWELNAALIEEGKRQKTRPYISAITPLKDQPSHYGVAVFDGSVRVYDLEAQKTTFHGKEHKNRVWAIENLSTHCFASCADDGYIKLWDRRQGPKSTFTVKDNPKVSARVSILLNLENNQLLSGSCPDKVKQSATKAQFSFWDIRHL